MDETQPQPQAAKPRRCRLYIGNVPKEYPEADLKKIFEQHGGLSDFFMNEGKGFGFACFNSRGAAESAKAEIDGRLVNGRPLRVRFAAHPAAIKIKHIPKHVSNELLFQAFARFGRVERAVVFAGDRGAACTEGVVEFAHKRTMTEALETVNKRVLLLTSPPLPIVAEPLEGQDEEEGCPERFLPKTPEYNDARKLPPRVPEPETFEANFGAKWKDLFEQYRRKQIFLEEEFDEAKKKLELEMDNAFKDLQAAHIRKDLERRQAELEVIEADRRRAQEELQKELDRRQMQRFGTGESHPGDPFGLNLDRRRGPGPLHDGGRFGEPLARPGAPPPAGAPGRDGLGHGHPDMRVREIERAGHRPGERPHSGPMGQAQGPPPPGHDQRPMRDQHMSPEQRALAEQNGHAAQMGGPPGGPAGIALMERAKALAERYTQMNENQKAQSVADVERLLMERNASEVVRRAASSAGGGEPRRIHPEELQQHRGGGPRPAFDPGFRGGGRGPPGPGFDGPRGPGQPTAAFPGDGRGNRPPAAAVDPLIIERERIMMAERERMMPQRGGEGGAGGPVSAEIQMELARRRAQSNPFGLDLQPPQQRPPHHGAPGGGHFPGGAGPRGPPSGPAGQQHPHAGQQPHAGQHPHQMRHPGPGVGGPGGPPDKRPRF